MPYRLIKSADKYRGTFLFLAGFMFLTPSINFLFSRRRLNSMEGLAWLPDFALMWHLGLVFTASCLFASVVGLLSKRLRHWHRLISYAYIAAMGPPMIMVMLGIWSIIAGAPALPWLINMPMYGALAAMIYLVSEWPNPPREPTWPVSLPPTAPPPPKEA